MCPAQSVASGEGNDGAGTCTLSKSHFLVRLVNCLNAATYLQTKLEVEYEFLRMQRAYRLMEAERKAYADETKKTIKKQSCVN